LTERGSAGVFRKARFAPLRGGLRPGLTENAGAAFEIAGRDEETARNRTKKQALMFWGGISP
jgi:hypothetical protein